MSKAKLRCEHLDYDVSIDSAVYTNSNIRTIKMAIRCKDCGQPMRFLGMSTHVDPELPSSSTDDLSVRLPFLPQYEELELRLVRMQ